MLLPSAFHPHAECTARHLFPSASQPAQGPDPVDGMAVLTHNDYQNTVPGALPTLEWGWRPYLRELALDIQYLLNRSRWSGSPCTAMCRSTWGIPRRWGLSAKPRA